MTLVVECEAKRQRAIGAGLELLLAIAEGLVQLLAIAVPLLVTAVWLAPLPAAVAAQDLWPEQRAR